MCSYLIVPVRSPQSTDKGLRMEESLSLDGLAPADRRAGASVPEIGIALLIDLAKRGEINPWDVQVIDVIDRYLSQVVPVGDASQLQREVALSQSGQAFLYASMLVLLKADSLVRSESEEEEPELAGEELLEGEDAAGRREQLYLERQLRRRAVAQPPQRRRVTLQELIEQLQVMAEAMQDTPARARRRRPAAGSKAQAARAIAELAQQENLSELATALERFLQEHWLQIAGEHDWLELEQLLDRWSPNGRQSASEPHPPSESAADRERNDHRVGVFWALLLLSAQSKVELTQEEFYRDLKIRALPQAL